MTLNVVDFSMSVIPDPDRRRRARESAQPSSLHQFAQSSSDETAGGRYAKQEGSTPQVVGADGPPSYPQLPASSPWSGAQPGPGDEPPLSPYENPALASPTGMSQPVVTGGPPANEQSEADLAVSFDRGDGGPSSSSDNDGGFDDAA